MNSECVLHKAQEFLESTKGNVLFSSQNTSGHIAEHTHRKTPFKWKQSHSKKNRGNTDSSRISEDHSEVPMQI